MRRYHLPWELFLGYPSRNGQSLKSTTAGVRSWDDVIIVGTYTEREALPVPVLGDLFFQTDYVVSNPPGMYFYSGRAWTPCTALYCPETDRFYPIYIELYAHDATRPTIQPLDPI